VRQCRQQAERALRGAGVPGVVIDDAMTVLGELAGNAVRHAGTEFRVVVRVDEELRLEVSDLDTRPPALLGLDAESTSGRGLHLVSLLATDWGWQTAESDAGVSGKRVWAELSLDIGRQRD
jgi:anti-sigma regulatory factor (Ser/Thr protein kinase)